jgi:hypothetical protein
MMPLNSWGWTADPWNDVIVGISVLTHHTSLVAIRKA